MFARISLILAILVILSTVSLTGCDQKTRKPVGSDQVVRPPEVARPTTKVKKPKSKLCVGFCMGPRIDLGSGKLKIGPGFGVGLGL